MCVCATRVSCCRRRHVRLCVAQGHGGRRASCGVLTAHALRAAHVRRWDVKVAYPGLTPEQATALQARQVAVATIRAATAAEAAGLQVVCRKCDASAPPGVVRRVMQLPGEAARPMADACCRPHDVTAADGTVSRVVKRPNRMVVRAGEVKRLGTSISPQKARKACRTANEAAWARFQRAGGAAAPLPPPAVAAAAPAGARAAPQHQQRSVAHEAGRAVANHAAPSAGGRAHKPAVRSDRRAGGSRRRRHGATERRKRRSQGCPTAAAAGVKLERPTKKRRHASGTGGGSSQRAAGGAASSTPPRSPGDSATRT